ncbi:MAG: hypothetical protein U9P90_04605 [Patescibacteria group bacterium]|nr:hypothetical protein [Patescibacteria group bacterium]
MKKRFRKDYHKKNYENPFFQNRRKEKSPRQYRLKISSCLFVIVAMAWFIFLFFSPFFRIENIDFGDTDKELQAKIKLLLEAEFEKRSFLLFSEKNFFVFDTENLEDHLGAIFLLNELKIEKQFPNTLLIKAQEKSDVLVLLVGNEGAFFVDKRGLVVDIVPETFKTYSIDTEGGATSTVDGMEVNLSKMELSDDVVRKMPIVDIEGIEEANIRDEVLSEELVAMILGVHQNLLNKLGVSPKLFEIGDTEEGKMTVTTKDGWEMYFLINEPSEPIEEQLENLKVILLEKVGDDRYLLDYVDLRFGDKIYFKYIE